MSALEGREIERVGKKIEGNFMVEKKELISSIGSQISTRVVGSWYMLKSFASIFISFILVYNPLLIHLHILCRTFMHIIIEFPKSRAEKMKTQ